MLMSQDERSPGVDVQKPPLGLSRLMARKTFGHKPRTVSERKTVYSFWLDPKSLVLLGKKQAKLSINQNRNSRTLIPDPEPVQGRNGR